MAEDSQLRIEFVPSISDIGQQQWAELNSSDNPFTRFEFLAALEASGCVGGDTGWLPRHILILRGDKPIAVLPSYLKQHSYGEYVFDWSWAQAYAEAGLDYYPKLITAIPFTPTPGPRLLCNITENRQELMSNVFEVIQSKAEVEGYSGWHLLFPQQELADCSELPMLQRQDIQFHWRNQNYQCFDDFLATLRSSKRKQLRRERRIVAEQGVEMHRYSGTEITAWVLENFYICYCQTYLRRSGHSGYLNQKFFEAIVESMAEQMMIILAVQDGQAIAASLFFYDHNNLYGRYWGCMRNIDCLHFEACYYQGIEFSIERNLQNFNPGTQGEHKLVRGFEPIKTYSLHWVEDHRFQNALEDFMQRESEHKNDYQAAARAALPFRRDQSNLSEKLD